MATIKDFLSGLASDRKALGAFISDPDQAVADAGLDDDDRDAVLSRDPNRINARMAALGETMATAVLVVSAEDLQAAMNPVGLTLVPNTPVTFPIRQMFPTQLFPTLNPQIAPTVLPQVTPQIQPQFWPQVVTPQITLQVTPQVQPQIWPQIVTPQIQPQVQPQVWPQIVTPQITLQVAPQIQPQVQPQIWPQIVAPQISPVFQPQIWPQIWPVIQPQIVSPQIVVPMFTPMVSPQFSQGFGVASQPYRGYGYYG